MTDILSESENLIRKYKLWAYYNNSTSRYTLPPEDALGPIYALKNLLMTGIEVVHHQFNGCISKSVLKYFDSNRQIELKTPYTNFFGVTTYAYKVYMLNMLKKII